MKTYEVQVRGVKECFTMQAASAQEACAKCGCMIGECYVREVRK